MLGDKLEKKSLRQLQLERVQNKGDGFYIGSDENLARAAKKAEQIKYSAQLSADSQNTPREFMKKEHEEVPLSPKGFTGLQIGEFYSN